MQFHFAYLWVLIAGIPVVLLLTLIKVFLRPLPRYVYAPVSMIRRAGKQYQVPVYTILAGIRFIILILCLLLMARPQWIDRRQESTVKGIDIMLAIDVSGSMELFDDLKDQTRRIDAAKREAITFVQKRHHDPIGVVLFGNVAVSRVPATLDKSLLTQTIEQISIGDIDHNGTKLLTGLATAINRLRDSQAKSKVIVLLTDGMSQGETIAPDTVINLAKKFGIRVYTLGVGSKDHAYGINGFGQLIPVETPIDEKLLKRVAFETGGQFFSVTNAREMAAAYQHIDALEKVEYTTPFYQNYYEAFDMFIWWLFGLFMFEMIARFFWWWSIV